jgi:Domain of unknown function (DUF5666)
MRRTILRLSLAAFTLVGFISVSLAAQETKNARGTVTAMAADTITVKAGEREMKFTVDAKTVVTAEGAGTASREAAASGKSLTIKDVLKVGAAVEVEYHETGGTMHAARIRRIPSVGPGGGGTSDERAETRSDTATGTVQTVSASSLTITGSAGGSGKFTQTFTIDTNTKVVAVGAGTASAAAKEKGQSLGIKDYLATGDEVSVTYQKKGEALLATQIRVTRKAVK